MRVAGDHAHKTIRTAGEKLTGIMGDGIHNYIGAPDGGSQARVGGADAGSVTPSARSGSGDLDGLEIRGAHLPNTWFGRIEYPSRGAEGSPFVSRPFDLGDRATSLGSRRHATRFGDYWVHIPVQGGVDVPGDPRGHTSNAGVVISPC